MREISVKARDEEHAAEIADAARSNPDWVATMADDAIVFALANPVPEVMPEQLPDNVAVVATGRSDYPNQINNERVVPAVAEAVRAQAAAVGATRRSSD